MRVKFHQILVKYPKNCNFSREPFGRAHSVYKTVDFCLRTSTVRKIAMF